MDEYHLIMRVALLCVFYQLSSFIAKLCHWKIFLNYCIDGSELYYYGLRKTDLGDTKIFNSTAWSYVSMLSILDKIDCLYFLIFSENTSFMKKKNKQQFCWWVLSAVSRNRSILNSSINKGIFLEVMKMAQLGHGKYHLLLKAVILKTTIHYTVLLKTKFLRSQCQNSFFV